MKIFFFQIFTNETGMTSTFCMRSATFFEISLQEKNEDAEEDVKMSLFCMMRCVSPA